MKNLFGIILSLQLMITPIGFAHAEDTPTGGDLGDCSKTAETGLSDEYLRCGTGSKGGYDFYVNQIMTIATSSIGASILTQCLEGIKVPSIATFMAGSLTHIMSEIVGAKAKNERHHKKMQDLEIKFEDLKKKGDTSQLEALKAALQEEKDTEDFLENRKKWMIAVTAIYTAAMGMAIAEEIYANTAGGAGGASACSASASSCTMAAAACAAQCAGGIAGLIGFLKGIENAPMDELRAAVNEYCLAYTPNLTGCNTFGNLYLSLAYGACKLKPVDGGTMQLSWGTLLNLAYGFGASTAAAKQGEIAQYGTMVVSLLPMLVKSTGVLVSKMYNFPIPRSITFGAAAVFSGTVTAGLSARANKAMHNITKLSNAISQFEVQTDGGGGGIDINPDGGNIAGAGPGNNNSPKLGSLKDLPSGTKKKECFSQGSKGIELSSGGCANPIKLSKIKPSQFKLPAINHVAGLSSDMAQALANGDESAAANIAGEIGSYAARVKAETEKLKAQYNELQKKEKRPTVDFDKSIKERVASLQGELQKTAASNGMNLAQAGAALSGDDEPIADSAIPEVKTASAPDAIPDVAVDPLAGLNSSSEYSDEEVPSGVAAGKAEQSLDDFESTVEDINKKSDVSIFKQLSNRYILNYTKIFEKKKAPAPADEPAKN